MATPTWSVVALVESFAQDVRHACRGVLRSPGFSLVALLTLATGIGVNAAVSAVANAALFRGFPLVRENDRILYLTTTRNAVSYPDFKDWQSQAESFVGIALVRGVFNTLSSDGDAPATYFTTQITANGFKLLGVSAILGRDFLPSDQQPGAQPVVILRHDLWRSRFDQDPAIIGTPVRLNGVATVVIGVMPPEFSFPENQALWTPLVPDTSALQRELFYARYAFGRLSSAATRQSAASEMDTIGRRLSRTYPATNGNLVPVLRNFREFFIGAQGTTAYQAVWGAVGFVLLIACGNVAILFLQRAMRRSRDISVRLALGAGRSRIIRQILIESFLVSGLAGVLGWWIAQVCVRGYAFAQAGGSSTAVLSHTIDSRLLLYMLAVSTGSGLLVGLPAALWITRSNINHMLKDHGRSATAGARATLFSDLVIAAEVGLALIVLSGAGLMARSLVNVYAANIGVNTSNVLTMSLFIPRQHYEGEAQQISFYQRLIARLEVVPGVQSVAIASVPPTEAAARAPYAIADALPMEAGAQPTVARMAVSPGYFQTMEAPIVSGREFGEFDGPSHIPVAIVNEAFARRTWPADQALGKRLRLFRDGVPLAWMTVVGVASDIIQDDRTRQVVEPLVYVPYQQRPQQNMFVFARTRVEPATLATAFTAEVYAMDPNLPTPGLMPLVERFARAYAFERNMTAVFLVFATVALFLALVGLYAIVAHSISTRTREIGIRRAMGATSRQIRGLVLRQGARPLGAGLIAGVLASVALSRTLQSILVRVSALDPATLSATSLLLIVTGAAGCLLSARHALRIDPAIVLRHE